MPAQKAVVVANLIKFGIPFGILLGVSNAIFTALFRTGGISYEVVGQSFMMLALSIFGGFVLGLIRSRNA